jgi:DNA-directed RNA polymerase subunit beta'
VTTVFGLKPSILKGETIEDLRDRIIGRFAVNDILHPQTGEVICMGQELVDESKADIIVESGISKVQVRSVLTCEAKHGVCVKCYGRNLGNGRCCGSRRSYRYYCRPVYW